MVVFIWICFTFLTFLGIFLAFFYKKLSEKNPKNSKYYKETSVKQLSYDVHIAQPTMPLATCMVLIMAIFLPLSILDFILILIPFVLIQMIFLKIKKILIEVYKK